MMYLGPCASDAAPMVFTVRDLSMWTLSGDASPMPAFATRVGTTDSADLSWLYFTSNQPLDRVRVHVRYAGGRTSWAYPVPTSVRGELTWTGVASPPVNGGAWATLGSTAARALGGPIIENGVLMHAGSARFRSPVEMRDGDIIAARGERTIFIVTRRGFEEHRAFGAQHVLVHIGDHATLRQRLLEELVERGASEEQAGALLEVRGEMLLLGARPHALYFLPRELIDRAQPLRVTPAPDTMVRIRLFDDYR